eukprot:3602231-Rhodomonas_salina.1
MSVCLSVTVCLPACKHARIHASLSVCVRCARWAVMPDADAAAGLVRESTVEGNVGYGVAVQKGALVDMEGGSVRGNGG